MVKTMPSKCMLVRPLSLVHFFSRFFYELGFMNLSCFCFETIPFLSKHQPTHRHNLHAHFRWDIVCHLDNGLRNIEGHRNKFVGAQKKYSILFFTLRLLLLLQLWYNDNDWGGKSANLHGRVIKNEYHRLIWIAISKWYRLKKVSVFMVDSGEQEKNQIVASSLSIEMLEWDEAKSHPYSIYYYYPMVRMLWPLLELVRFDSMYSPPPPLLSTSSSSKNCLP